MINTLNYIYNMKNYIYNMKKFFTSLLYAPFIGIAPNHW